MLGLHIADIFRGHWGRVSATLRLPTVVHKAVRAIMACQTPLLGGHANLCGNGHLTIGYNSCRSRSCPRCASRRVGQWLARQAGTLLGCGHHHVILTVPHEVNPLWMLNRREIGKLVFTASRDSLLALLGDRRYLGAVPGILMALHTWGQQLSEHLHTHCVVTAGGVDAEGRWRFPRRRRLLATGPLRKLFKGKFVAGLRLLSRRGRLRLPSGWTAPEVERVCRALELKRWNVQVRERYVDPTAVLNYLGRYVNGGPFGERRLLAYDGHKVTFRYRGRRDENRHQVMSLEAEEFIRRYIQHVPPEGFHMVRGFGLYRRGAGSDTIRAAAEAAVPITANLRATLTARAAAPDPNLCPQCGSRFRVTAIIRPIHAPPRRPGLAA